MNFKLGLTYSKEHNLDFILALKNRWNEMHECERLFYYNVAVSRFIVTILSKKTAGDFQQPCELCRLLSLKGKHAYGVDSLILITMSKVYDCMPFEVTVL